MAYLNPPRTCLHIVINTHLLIRLFIYWSNLPQRELKKNSRSHLKGTSLAAEYPLTLFLEPAAPLYVICPIYLGKKIPGVVSILYSNICRRTFVITVLCSAIESLGTKKTFPHRHKTLPDADCFYHSQGHREARPSWFAFLGRQKFQVESWP